jgi:NADH dehydrogenase FAD-containing subunit
MKFKKKVIIIGGGFAGSIIAKKLEKKFETLLIDNKEYFEYKPGIIKLLNRTQKESKFKVFHEKYLKKTRIIIGNVTNLTKHYAEVMHNSIDNSDNNEQIYYDYAIISTGSRYELLNIDKLVYNFNSIKEILKSKELFYKSKRVLIIGGGLVGIELACELAQNYKDKKIILSEANLRLAARMNNEFFKYCEKKLLKNNVEIIYDFRIDKIVKNSFKNPEDKIVNADLAYSCTGFKPNTKFLEKHFKKNLSNKGYIRVNSNLQLINNPNIFAAGDILDINEEKLAQNAEIHTKIIAKNIVNLEKNKKLVNYNTKPRITITSLGKFCGIINYKSLNIYGIIPIIIKNLFEKYYLLKLKFF